MVQFLDSSMTCFFSPQHYIFGWFTCIYICRSTVFIFIKTYTPSNGRAILYLPSLSLMYTQVSSISYYCKQCNYQHSCISPNAIGRFYISCICIWLFPKTSGDIPFSSYLLIFFLNYRYDNFILMLIDLGKELQSLTDSSIQQISRYLLSINYVPGREY